MSFFSLGRSSNSSRLLGQLYHDYRDKRFRTVRTLKATPSTIVGYVLHRALASRKLILCNSVTDDQKIIVLDFSSGLDARNYT